MAAVPVSTTARVGLLGLTLLLFASAPPVAAQTGDTPQVEPPHVYALSLVVRDQIGLLQRHLDVSLAPGTGVEVTRARPYEVYFLARSLLVKADQLVFEHLRTIEPEPPIPEGELQPADVYGLLVVAQERLARVQAHLGAPPSTLEPALEPTRIPTDVFNSLLAANQQVNVLLAEPASPGDVFQVVSWALA